MNNAKELYEICQGDGDSTNLWDRRFLKDAAEKASWSKDPSTKCGSVIVDSKRRKVSEGYNGFARGVKDTPFRLENRDEKYELTIHAEVNAILFSKQDLEGCTLYVVPMGPCSRCASLIIQAGISRVVAPKLTDDLKERWGSSVSRSRQIFKEAGVEFAEI